MRIPVILAVLVGLAVQVRHAQSQDIMSAIRVSHWTQAQAAAASYADPVAAKLVSYFRMLTQGAATASEISDFLSSSPDWPSQAVLLRRRDAALASEPDTAAALALCDQATVSLPAALTRCAAAFLSVGQTIRATDSIRRAWLNLPGDAGSETLFMQQWGGTLTAADQWQRFDRLAWTDPVSATRQMLRLEQSDRTAAAARLALHRDDPTAATLVAALTQAQRAAPAVFLEQARWLRRAGRDDEALALWRASGTPAEADCSPEYLPQFWAERNLLARRRLRAGDNAGAYALADGHRQRDAEQVADAEFLAGFIALRWLADAPSATSHFTRLLSVSGAAITTARAHYWLGRAAAQRSDRETAAAEYARAASFGTTYYGQLAAIALGQDPAVLAANLAKMPDPVWTDQQVIAFAGRELTRAAGLLISWGDQNRVRSFLLRLAELAPDDADRALAAHLATGLGMPDLAITIARRAGRDGVMLPASGWPVPITIPPGPVPASVALGIIRQESSFDTDEISSAGARGLMQLMPGTAREIGQKLGLAAPAPALTANPELNIALGTAYLRSLLDRFGGSLPLAAAGYNAGPSRVQEWLAGNGDPRSGPVSMIDWVELIPISETRNYVQRVIENIFIYAGKQGDQPPMAFAQWQPPGG
jgi:soluble lytic murein transglycosylase